MLFFDLFLFAGYIFDVTGSYSGGFKFAGVMSGVTIALVLGSHLLWTKLIKDDRWPRFEPTVITQDSAGSLA